MSRRAQLATLAGTGASFLSLGLLVPVLPRYVTCPLDANLVLWAGLDAP